MQNRRCNVARAASRETIYDIRGLIELLCAVYDFLSDLFVHHVLGVINDGQLESSFESYCENL